MVERREFLRGTAALTTGGVAGCTLLDSEPEGTNSDAAVEQNLKAVPEDVTNTAIESGRWDDPAVWTEQGVPGEDARVLIQDDVSVTLRGDTAPLDWLRVDGELIVSPSVTTHLVAETVMSLPGSRLEIGTAHAPIQPDVEARVTFRDTGPIDEERDPEREGRGLLAHGDLTIHGAEKTAWTRLADAPTAGEKRLELTERPTNWQEGDRLVVPGVVPNETQDEERTIRSVDGTAVSLDAAFGADHVPPKESLDAYVLNLSRNVVFESESADTKRRGHAMITSTGTTVKYARFDDLGRTDKRRPLTNPVRGEEASEDGLETNLRSRYPLHYHRSGIEAEPHTAEGVVVDGSPGWGIVNHHSHARITDCITRDVLGAGFVAEGGNERGSFERNFALRSEGSGERIDDRSAGAHGGDPPIDDFGHAGHGFWLQSPLVAVTDCVAAGHRHQAFVWWLRPLLDGDLAEGTTIEDSRVTYWPNVPVEYVNLERISPLWEAIQEGRFANGRHNDLMRETGKIPSTFAPLATVSGNVAFASAGGADFSRHNFKWKHERFSEFNAIDDMTVFNIGRFVDEDGDVHEPDPPKHLRAGHQGRGGSVGVSFRYTSNVSLKNSYLHGGGTENGFARPFHDYLWTNVIEGCRFEGWDWAAVTGEHRIDWIRDNTFENNNVDIQWSFDNAGPTKLENNEFDTLLHEFQPLGQKATEVFEFDQRRGVQVDGRTSHVAQSVPDFVPFPDEDDLSGVNNIEDIEGVSDETALVGLTNAELMDEYGIAVGGALMPEDAVEESFTESR
ncbi:G8 domain-containing protein, partial [Natronomonas sp.]|uniref:G8 domain-containing protein n=1 Tax=Natronomonas sp. TaxID=2184060 RepID=UPI003974D7FF